MKVEQRSKKTEENKHGAVIAGCSAESETLFWEQKSKFESTRCLYNKYSFASTIRCKINRMVKLDHL